MHPFVLKGPHRNSTIDHRPAGEELFSVTLTTGIRRLKERVFEGPDLLHAHPTSFGDFTEKSQNCGFLFMSLDS